MQRISTWLCLAVVLPMAFPATSVAKIHLFALSKNAQQVGDFAIEIDRPSAGPHIRQKNYSRITGILPSVDLLRQLMTQKQVAIELDSPHRTIEIKQNNIEWQISSKSPDVRIVRKENGRRVDDLQINPILPVYDLAGLIMAIKRESIPGNLDFYLVEEGHQKRFRLDKGSNLRYVLSYRESEVATLELSPAGMLRMVFSDNLYFRNLNGYVLQERCTLNRYLRVTRRFGTQQMLSAWHSKNPETRLDINAATRSARLDSEMALNIPSGISFFKRIDIGMIKSKILVQMGRRDASTGDSSSQWIDVAFDEASQCFYPMISPNAELNYVYEDIKRQIGVIDPKIEISPDFKSLIIGYTKSQCLSDSQPLYCLPVDKSIHERINIDPTNDQQYWEVSGNQQEAVVTGYQKTFWGGREIGRTSIKATQMHESLEVPKGYSLDYARFDTQGYGKNMNQICVEYAIKACRDNEFTEKRSFANDFTKRYGIDGQHLTFTASSQDVAVRVQASFNDRRFEYCPQRDKEFVNRFSREGFIKSRINISGQGGHYDANFFGGLHLPQSSVKELLNIPLEVRASRSGNSVEYQFDDYSCQE